MDFGFCNYIFLINLTAYLNFIELNINLIFLVALFGSGYGAVQLYLRALNGIHKGGLIYVIQVLFGIYFLLAVSSIWYLELECSSSQLAFIYYFFYIACYFFLANLILSKPYKLNLLLSIKIFLKRFKESKFFLTYIFISICTTQLDGFYLGISSRFYELAQYSVVSKIFLGVCYSFTYVFFTISQPLISKKLSESGVETLKIPLISMVAKASISVMIFTVGFEILKSYIFGLVAPEIMLKSESDHWVYWFYCYFLLRTVLECLEFFCIAINQPKITIRIGLYLAFSVALCLGFLIKYDGLLAMLQGLVVFYMIALVCYVYSVRKIFIRGF